MCLKSFKEKKQGARNKNQETRDKKKETKENDIKCENKLLRLTGK